MDRASFPSQSPRESRGEDKPVKLSQQLSQRSLSSSTPGITNLQLRNLQESSRELQPPELPLDKLINPGSNEDDDDRQEGKESAE